MICDTLNNLSNNNLILTVNQRLCIELQRKHQNLQTKQCNTAWNTALITPINTWIYSIWEQYSTQDSIPLSNFQELSLWRDIIQKDPDHTLLQSEQTAALAKQAWQTIQLWQLDLASLQHASNLETQQFYNWANQFEAICKQKKLQPQASLILQIKDLLQKTTIPIPQAVFLIGFDQFPPALSSLIEYLQTRTLVEQITPNKQAKNIHRCEFTDEEHEIQQIALWAKTEFQQNNNTHIACIFPRLTEQRTTIARIFNETFHIGSYPSQQGQSESLAFNISAAIPLPQYPIIQTAYQLLTFCSGQINIEQISYLLQSPYLASNDHDIDLGAQIDFELRAMDEINLTISDIFTVLVNLKPAQNFKRWIMSWHKLRTTINQLPTKQTATHWANSIRQLLSCMGWPGGRILNSQEYQLCQKLNTCLQEFASFDLLHSELTCKEAIRLFLKQLTQTTFQPEGSIAPIQILGVLESSGLQFDKIWLANLDDEQWPPAAKPNPFLPIELQRQQQTPHSSAERELQFCKTTMHRLFNSAEHVFVSSYHMSNDQHKQPSQLINDIEIATLGQLAPSNLDLLLKQYPNHAITQSITDKTCSPIRSTDTIKGGSHILKQQALCPFRAYADIRLGTETINQPSLGLKPTQRGIATHQVLENIWGKLQDSSTLHKTDHATLQQLIKQQVKVAIKDIKLPSNNKTNKIFLKTEELRLVQIINQWLSYEKKRSPFKVLSCEQTTKINLAGLNLQLRLDRIDELADERKIIIDYKTSLTSINSWLNDRLQEPQLPLYCIDRAQDQPIAGLAFAQLQASSLRFKGIINDETITEKQLDFTNCSHIKKSEPITWTQLVAKWHSQLTELSVDFTQGNANRSPSNTTVCQTCQFQALCRIFES